MHFEFRNKQFVFVFVIRMLFSRNDEFHNHNTRQSNHLHLPIGKREDIYKSFTFHGIHIWNYLIMHIPTDVPYACCEVY